MQPRRKASSGDAIFRGGLSILSVEGREEMEASLLISMSRLCSKPGLKISANINAHNLVHPPIFLLSLVSPQHFPKLTQKLLGDLVYEKQVETCQNGGWLSSIKLFVFHVVLRG